MTIFIVSAGEAREECGAERLFEVADRLAKCGPISIIERDASGAERTILSKGASGRTQVVEEAPGVVGPASAEPITAPAFSTFEPGDQVVDEAARARIERQHASLTAQGVTVDASAQLYATGTRMARDGYGTQRARKAEHDAKMPLREAADALRAAVVGEDREDRTVSAGDLARAIDVKGKVSVFGLTMTEQAIRGLVARLESPALSYVLGLQRRAGVEQRSELDRSRDCAQLAEVLRHECRQAPDVEVTLRTRRNAGDIFATVSPGYTSADAPTVLDQVMRGMPKDARGTWSYCPTSTTWELRADVWTPTPVDEQAVGEAFSGYVSFQSRDNGTASFRGGGGVLLLRCLNASTYTAESSATSRVHRGRVLYDVGAMLRGATKAIHALCEAWGANRAAPVEAPPVPLSVAIPGFWSYLLRDRSSELAGVLPGRSAEHVQGLTAAFHAERREPSRLVRSDFAQAWTQHAQAQPTPVRREAESAIGRWLVKRGPLGCDLPAS